MALRYRTLPTRPIHISRNELTLSGDRQVSGKNERAAKPEPVSRSRFLEQPRLSNVTQWLLAPNCLAPSGTPGLQVADTHLERFRSKRTMMRCDPECRTG